MNRSIILEAMYETIKESLEWGFDSKEYGQFVDGVMAMTEKILEKEKVEEEKLNNGLNALESSINKCEDVLHPIGNIAVAHISNVCEHKDDRDKCYCYADAGRA